MLLIVGSSSLEALESTHRDFKDMIVNNTVSNCPQTALRDVMKKLICRNSDLLKLPFIKNSPIDDEGNSDEEEN